MVSDSILIKEGGPVDGVMVTRVFYAKGNSHSRRFDFHCSRCGNIQHGATITNFKRKPEKVCNECAIKNNASKKVKYKHPLYSKEMYHIWSSMNYRCDPSNKDKFPTYAGKGIVVCKRWSYSSPNGIINFLNDMGARPTKHHSLDRIDTNGNYEPNNVRWATQKEQCNNSTRNSHVYYSGQKMTVSSFAELTGQKPNTITTRMKRGWTNDEIIQGYKKESFKRPYSKTISEENFKELLTERLEHGVGLLKLAEVYGLSHSNLSRVFRREDVLTYYKNEVKYEK